MRAVVVTDDQPARAPLGQAQECSDDLLSPETEHLKVLLKPAG